MRAAERTEGWGSIVNSRKAHYFDADGRSLCGRYLSFRPMWEAVQYLGPQPTKGDDTGTCAACWKKRAKTENEEGQVK